MFAAPVYVHKPVPLTFAPVLAVNTTSPVDAVFVAPAVIITIDAFWESIEAARTFDSETVDTLLP